MGLVSFDINSVSDVAFKTLLQKQVQFLRKNETNIMKKHVNSVKFFNERI